MKTVNVWGVVSKGNGDAFISKERHTSLSIGGGQAGQGYPCVLIECQGYDGYNGCFTGSVSSTLGINCGISTGRNGVVIKVGKDEQPNSIEE